MNIKNLSKYLIRFLLLQSTVSALTIYFFDSFLIWDLNFKNEIYLNLIEDKNRFLPFVDDSLVSVDAILVILIFVFLIILYSTNFYTYVNELSYSLNRNLVGEYFQLYLLWSSYILVSFFILRFNNLFRGNLIVFTLLMPLVFMVFRNTEFVSSLLGRSITNETFITLNLDNDSKFRNLRIMTFRKNLGSYFLNILNTEECISLIDSENKKNKINLIIIYLSNESLEAQLEEYLINLNKKVLIISKKENFFNNTFLYRKHIIDNNWLCYFNNDIQYGSKFILKRVFDILFSLIGIMLLSPIFLLLSLIIFVKDGSPVIIQQNRVGLHGNKFNMYKFRSMKNSSHEQRVELKELNESTGPLFKIKKDPRIINGLNFIRKYSLDELPQLINVIKGEMSLVGPRPLFSEDTEMFDVAYMRRLNVLPGITGLLQINERNTSDFNVWYKYDLEYIENWSLFLDFEILLKTPIAIFSKKIKGF